MLKVILVDQEVDMGGVEVSTLSTAVGLSSGSGGDVKVVVICPRVGPLQSALSRAGIPVIISPRPRSYSVTARVAGRFVTNPIAVLWAAGSIVVVVVRLIKALPKDCNVIVTKGLLAHFYGGMSARLIGRRCVWHVQEVANSNAMWGLFGKVLNLAAGWLADCIVADAQSVARQFTSNKARLKVRVIYNGVDTRRFSPEGARAELPFIAETDTITIGQVGRIVPAKGQLGLLEAFCKVLEYHNARLIFVGSPLFDNDEYLKKLNARVRALALDDRVHFLGFRSDVPELLRSLDIVVHPSIEPDSPIGVIEAMATGKAVIATAVPGTDELIEHGVNGFLVEPGNPTALVADLLKLVDNATLRERLGQNARKRALAAYDDRVFERNFKEALHCATAP